MRLMAHLSGDPDLLRVFTDGGDVFRRIAAAVQGGGKKAAEITEEERRQVLFSFALFVIPCADCVSRESKTCVFLSMGLLVVCTGAIVSLSPPAIVG